MKYIDELEFFRERNWKNFIKLDGIIKEVKKEEILDVIEEDIERIIAIIESNIPCAPTIEIQGLPSIKDILSFNSQPGDIKQGATNYFIINDMGYGPVCEKCGGHSYVLLLQDNNYLDNLEEKVWLPSAETYYNMRIDVDEIGSAFPVPVNPDKDLWVCPICNEIHKFKYDNETGLEFDQQVI